MGYESIFIMESLTLTLLVDDFDGAAPGFQKAYGLSILVNLPDGTKILFDTGSHGRDLATNCQALSLDPGDLSAVILSHDHFDHSGGLGWVLEKNHGVPVYVHGRWDDPNTHAGPVVPPSNRVLPNSRTEYSEIHPGVYLTRTLSSGDYGGILEHACWVITPHHRVLLTGCCHPGLYAFIEEGGNIPGDLDLPLVVVGGFHGSRFISAQVEALNPRLELLVYLHCTQYWRAFQRQFPGKCQTLRVGDTIEID